MYTDNRQDKRRRFDVGARRCGFRNTSRIRDENRNADLYQFSYGF